jgi:hypothetical protein
MKKSILFSIFTFSIVIVAVLFFSPKPVTGSGFIASQDPGNALPDSIQKFVQKACMDCHSNDGSSMARGKVNFSKWETYDLSKQAKKANEMAKELLKGDMPPKKWRANNPEKVPTAAETDMVVQWAKSYQK